MRYFFAVFFSLFCFQIFCMESHRLFGDFESVDSFRKTWEAPHGIWAAFCSEAKLSEFHVTNGKFSLHCSFKGSEKDTYPYLEYRFPESERDLSSFKNMTLKVFNPGQKARRIQGFFMMKSLADSETKVRVFFSFTIQPGSNTVSIPTTAKNGIVFQKTTEMEADWKNVEKFNIFINCPREDFELFFDEIYFGAKPQIQLQQIQKPEISAEKFTGDWEKIPGIPVCYTNIGVQAKFPSLLKVAYDADNLYIRIDCKSEFSPDAPEVAHDDPGLWNGDYIEIFLQHNQETADTYYQFAFNTSGSRFDCKVTGVAPVFSWDKDWDVKISPEKGSWYADVTLPWHIFDFRKNSPPEWSLNVFRGNKKSGETTALSPTGGSFHNPEKFLPLKMNAPSMIRYFTSIDSFQVKEPSIGKNTAHVSLNAKRRGKVLLELEGGKSVTKFSKDLKSGNSQFELPFLIAAADPQYWKLTLKDEYGRILSNARIFLSMPPPLSLKIISPYYRESIFSSEKVEKIQCVANINLPEMAAASSKLYVALEEMNGNVFAKSTFNVQKEISCEFDAELLPDGNFRVHAWLEDDSIGKTCETIKLLRVLPYKSNQVYPGKDRFLRVKGEPFFPIGVYPNTNAEDFPELRKAGFNTILFFAPYGKVSDKILQLLKSSGLYVVPVFAHHVQGGAKRSVPAYVPQLLKDQVYVYKDLPNLLAYNMLDEPNVFFQTRKEDYNEIYRLLTALDPYHPVQIVQCGEVNMPREHEEFCNIYEFDFYPGYAKNGLSFKKLSSVPLRVRLLRSILSPEKPVFVTFQGYDRVRTWDKFEQGRLANYTETRCLFYASASEGASGFYYWPFDDASVGCLQTRPEWHSIALNIQEFNIMLPVIFAKEYKGEWKAEGAPSENLHISVKQKYGYLYVIAAYSGEAMAELKFSGEIFRSISGFKVLGEERSIQVSNGKFSDRFDRYAVHLYTNDPNPPQIALLKENTDSVMAYENAFAERNKNNLLYRSYTQKKGSVRIALEMKDNLKPKIFGSPYHLFDGMRRSYFYFPVRQLPFTLNIQFKEAIRMDRIVLRSGRNTLLDTLNIQIFCESGWKKIGKVSNNKENVITFKFVSETIQKIQIEVTKASGDEYFFLDDLEGFLDSP